MCDNKVTSVNETAGKETEPQEKKNFRWILQLKSNLYINYKVIKRVLELIELDEFVFNERPWLKTIFDMAEDFTLADVLLECAGDENDPSVTESLRSTFDQLEEITDLPREVLVGVRQINFGLAVEEEARYFTECSMNELYDYFDSVIDELKKHFEQQYNQDNQPDENNHELALDFSEYAYERLIATALNFYDENGALKAQRLINRGIGFYKIPDPKEYENHISQNYGLKDDDKSEISDVSAVEKEMYLIQREMNELLMNPLGINHAGAFFYLMTCGDNPVAKIMRLVRSRLPEVNSDSFQKVETAKGDIETTQIEADLEDLEFPELDEMWLQVFAPVINKKEKVTYITPYYKKLINLKGNLKEIRTKLKDLTTAAEKMKSYAVVNDTEQSDPNQLIKTFADYMKAAQAYDEAKAAYDNLPDDSPDKGKLYLEMQEALRTCNEINRNNLRYADLYEKWKERLDSMLEEEFADKPTDEQKLSRAEKLKKRLEELKAECKKAEDEVREQSVIVKKRDASLKKEKLSDIEDMGIKVRYGKTSYVFSQNIYSLDNIIYSIVQPLGLYKSIYSNLQYSKNKRSGIYSKFDYYRTGTKDDPDKKVYQGSELFRIVAPFAVKTEKSELYQLITHLKEIYPVVYQASCYFDTVYSSSIKTEIKYWETILDDNKAIADKFTKYYSKLMEKAEEKLTPHEKNIVLYCRKQVDDYNELKDTIQPYLAELYDMQKSYEKNPADWLTSYLTRLDEELAQAKDDLMLADLSMDSAKSGALRIIEDMENGADEEELVDLMEEANEILEAHRTAQRNISKANGRIQILTEIKEEAAESVKKKASSPTIKVRTPYDPVINVGKHVNWIKPGVLKNTEFDAVLAEILK